MITVVKQRRRSFHMHVIKASEVEIRVRGEKAKIGSSGRHKRRGQLGMTGGCEVPIVGGLVIRAIGCDGQRTILFRVVNCMTKQSRGIACCVVTKGWPKLPWSDHHCRRSSNCHKRSWPTNQRRWDPLRKQQHRVGDHTDSGSNESATSDRRSKIV